MCHASIFSACGNSGQKNGKKDLFGLKHEVKNPDEKIDDTIASAVTPLVTPAEKILIVNKVLQAEL